MRIVKQSIFDKFECIADKCPDSCCKGWEIMIDEKHLEFYKNYEGNLKERIAKAVDFDREIIKFGPDEKCMLLNEDGLCSLVLDKGEQALSDTCHMYPRHVEEYESVREWSVAISCPYAAKLLIESDVADFLIEENDDPEPLEEDFEDFDFMLYSKLEDARMVLYDLVMNRNINIYNRMFLILDFAYGFQELLYGDKMYEIDEYIDKWNQKTHTEGRDYGTEVYDFVNNNIEILSELEVLRDDWKTFLDDYYAFIRLGKDYFIDKYIGRSDKNASSDLQKRCKYMENVLISFIYTYFLGAVYDEMAYAKAAMSVFLTITIDIIYVIQHDIKNKAFEYNEAVYRLAREIEHSDDNLNALEDYFDNMVIL